VMRRLGLCRRQLRDEAPMIVSQQRSIY
jgi:ribosomal protein S14